MRVLLDPNVILDVLLLRGPWLDEAAAVWQASQEERVTCCITASALTDIYYISRRQIGAEPARKVVRRCLDELELIPVGRGNVELAFTLSVPDLEGSLQVACAVREQLSAIVTRDQNGFPNSPVPIWSPTELIARLSAPPGPGDVTSPSPTPK